MQKLRAALQRGAAVMWIVPSIQEAYETLRREFKGGRTCYFPGEETLRAFKIEDAHALIAEAYLASVEPKYLITLATSYGLEAQNALLKLIEEPPHNVRLILVGERKSLFLPTIRSRTIRVDTPRPKRAENALGFDPAALDLKTIDEQIVLCSKMSREEIRDWVENLFFSLTKSHAKHGKLLSETELEFFGEVSRLIPLNTSAALIASTLLLAIHDKARR